MTTDLEKLVDTIDSISDLLDHLKKTGKGVTLSPEALKALENAGGGPFVPVEPEKKISRPAVSGSGNHNTLEEIRSEIGDCTRCGLHEGRTKLVFGAGSPTAELMFIGEGPGRDEDLQGIPFVGRAGKLLTRMIEGGLKKTREDVYIANIVKCRPPSNRNPLPDEAETCKQFLIEQIKVIKPRVICLLGAVATQNLLDTKTGISKLRGRWHEYMGIKVMPTFHPAALLRNPANKRPVWEDLQAIMTELGWR